MSIEKHTPGKWQYRKRFDGSLWLSLGDPATGPHYQGDLCAREADARLIVAAPDLLAALKVVLCFGEIPDQYRGEAYAAIAKAEGRQ